MNSAKGFLAAATPTRVAGCHATHRLTESQLDAVVRAVAVVVAFRQRILQAEQRPMEIDAFAFAQKLVVEALRGYPRDRSCFTCDHECSGYCHHWKQDVPSAALDAGCDHHQFDGAPF